MTSIESAGGPLLRAVRLSLAMLGACVAIVVAPSLPILLTALVAGLAAISTLRRMPPEEAAVRLAVATALAAAHPLSLVAGAQPDGLGMASLAPAALAGAWLLARLASRHVTVIDITDATLARSGDGAVDEAWVDPPMHAPRISRRPVRDPWRTIRG